ncbi:YonK family protein [Paenibacillus dendritiformis]|uniref:YonK family protein n=1 Tax=Paenibacillus dendritiformis TaxID=130049 RepID=UPI00387E120C
MAKKVHTYQLKGAYYHEKQVVEEYDKKTEETTYYSLRNILADFDQKNITISIKEEDEVPSVEQPFDEDE